MYFNSRAEAGQKLAEEMVQYKDSHCVVVALSEGAVLVGEQIAQQIDGELSLLLSEGIDLPGEHTTIGTVNQGGGFTYNSALSYGEIEDYYSEFHGYIEDQKRQKFSKMNRLLGGKGTIETSMLSGRVVILVSDGFRTGLSLDAAMSFLKPIKLARLIVATPIASVQAVDRMHILADELHCLSVTDNYISTSHYYNVDEDLSHDTILDKLNKFINDTPN
jgi:predicted phosphoribosyltransferase